jgi:hypothetical protein
MEFLEILRARQSTEWVELIRNTNRLRCQDPEIDFKLALLVAYNTEITNKEKKRRWDSLRQDDVNRAFKVYWSETLKEVKWSWDWEDIPDATWDGWCERVQKAREALEDEKIPQMHEVQRRLRTPAFFAELNEEWNELMREAIQTYRSYEERFRDISELRHWAGKARKQATEAEVKLKEWESRTGSFWFDYAMQKQSWDSRRGLYLKPWEEIQREAKDLDEEMNRRKEALKNALRWREKTEEKLQTHRKTTEIVVAYFKNLRYCWNRIQQLELKE